MLFRDEMDEIEQVIFTYMYICIHIYITLYILEQLINVFIFLHLKLNKLIV